MKHWKLVFAGLAFFAAFVLYIKNLVRPPEVTETPKPLIAVSFYPLEFLASRLTNTDYDVFPVISSGVEPHDFEPSPHDIVRLQEADIFFYNGLGFEPWVERITPTLLEHGVTVIDASALLDASSVSFLDLHSADTIDSDDSAEEEHGQFDPHYWLDPRLFADLAEEIKNQLAHQYPEDAPLFSSNNRVVQADIAAVYARYKQRLAHCDLDTVIVSHDAFGYLSRQFGFQVISIAGFSPQVQPSAKRLGELATLAKEQGIKTIFFESLVSPKLSETLASEIGATTAVLDPIEGISAADRAKGIDYVKIMEKNLDALAAAMQCR